MEENYDLPSEGKNFFQTDGNERTEPNTTHIITLVATIAPSSKVSKNLLIKFKIFS